MVQRILWCIPIFMLVACAGSKSAKTGAQAQVMYESLEPYRPKYPPLPKKDSDKIKPEPEIKTSGTAASANDETAQVLQKLDTLRQLNQRIKYTSGYRIQLYSGTSRDRVNTTKEQLYRILPDAEIYTEYRQPDFKVKFGDFTEKYEVQGYLAKVIGRFPDALVIEEPINIIRK